MPSVRRAAAVVTARRRSIDQRREHQNSSPDLIPRQQPFSDGALLRRVANFKVDGGARWHVTKATPNEAFRVMSRFDQLCKVVPEQGAEEVLQPEKKLSSLRQHSELYREMKRLQPLKGTLAWHRRRLALLTESIEARLSIAALVLANGVILGIAANSPDLTWCDTAETAFVAIFALELACKVFGYGGKFFQDFINIFDFVVILLSVTELIAQSVSESSAFQGNVSVLRMFRILRVLRVATMLEHLHILLEALVKALRSTFWICTLMTFFLYIFAVMATEYFGHSEGLRLAVAADPYMPGDTQQWFGTVGRSMLSLLQVATMDSWNSQIARPIVEYNPWAAVFFVGFLMIVGLGFLNLLTAAFVDTLSQTNIQVSSRNKRKQECYHMIDEFQNTHNLSHKLYLAMRAEVKEDWNQTTCFDVNRLLSTTPPYLGSIIKTELCATALSKCNLLSGVCSSFTRRLTNEMQFSRCIPNSMICAPESRGILKQFNSMLIVIQGQVALTPDENGNNNGIVDLLHDPEHICLVEEGGFFDAAMLLATGLPRFRVAMTRTDSVIAVLSQDSFYQALAKDLETCDVVMSKITGLTSDVSCMDISAEAQSLWDFTAEQAAQLPGHLPTDMSPGSSHPEFLRTPSVLGVRPRYDAKPKVAAVDRKCGFCDNKTKLSRCVKRPGWYMCGNHQHIADTHKELCGCPLTAVASTFQQAKDTQDHHVSTNVQL